MTEWQWHCLPLSLRSGHAFFPPLDTRGPCVCLCVWQWLWLLGLYLPFLCAFSKEICLLVFFFLCPFSTLGKFWPEMVLERVLFLCKCGTSGVRSSLYAQSFGSNFHPIKRDIVEAGWGNVTPPHIHTHHPQASFALPFKDTAGTRRASLTQTLGETFPARKQKKTLPYSWELFRHCVQV